MYRTGLDKTIGCDGVQSQVAASDHRFQLRPEIRSPARRATVSGEEASSSFAASCAQSVQFEMKRADDGAASLSDAIPRVANTGLPARAASMKTRLTRQR